MWAHERRIPVAHHHEVHVGHDCPMGESQAGEPCLEMLDVCVLVGVEPMQPMSLRVSAPSRTLNGRGLESEFGRPALTNRASTSSSSISSGNRLMISDRKRTQPSDVVQRTGLPPGVPGPRHK